MDPKKLISLGLSKCKLRIKSYKTRNIKTVPAGKDQIWQTFFFTFYLPACNKAATIAILYKCTYNEKKEHYRDFSFVFLPEVESLE